VPGALVEWGDAYVVKAAATVLFRFSQPIGGHMFRTARYVLAVLAVLAIGITGGSAASTKVAPTKQQMAQRILATKAVFSSAARAYLESVARNDHRLAPDSVGISVAAARASRASAVSAPAVGLPNVRVNNPAEDSHQVDQTTQSETSVAVSGMNVAVGFNDSQNALTFLTAGANLSGYAYSTNGGATFTDGGVLPNAPGNVNLGDPWLASDSSGAMYYSTLTIEGTTGNLLVGVASSANGGKTWTTANAIPPPNPGCTGKGCGPSFYSADKDALTTGPGVGNLYDVWDDFTFDPNTGGALSGLPVAHSTDGGHTWTITYASQVPLFDPSGGCSFNQYIGAQPLVANGVLYDAAELISVNDPNCVGAPVVFSEAIFISNDGGATWTAGANQPITSSTQGSSVFVLGPAMFMRNLEFPTLASFKGKVYMAWNDGGDGSGHSHIRLGQLNQFGQFASLAYITSGSNDEAQPAMSADTGLHIAYYQIKTGAGGTGSLDVKVSNSTNGRLFTGQRVTSQSFPGVFTLPQFDPIIAFTYMGDYIANVSDGTHQYMAWGDNRDMVHNFLWPGGRHDPDVFFAKQ
jgi:hypothetical protein